MVFLIKLVKRSNLNLLSVLRGDVVISEIWGLWFLIAHFLKIKVTFKDLGNFLMILGHFLILNLTIFLKD